MSEQQQFVDDSRQKRKYSPSISRLPITKRFTDGIFFLCICVMNMRTSW